MKTPVHRALLGCELPIIQAPMAGVQDAALAAAVSRAGGLGSLPCAMLEPDAIAHQVQAFRAQVDGPCNLNFFCHNSPAGNRAQHDAWLRVLAPYLQALSVTPGDIPAGAARKPFDEAALALVEALAPRVASFHFGLPAPALLERVKAAGATVLGCATTVDEAGWLAEHGADAVIAQGIEAGGHRGMFLSMDLATQLPTFELLPRVLQAIDLPVIAAGGISGPVDVARALALGATAAQVGTAFLLCPQAQTSALHRRALQSARAQRTEVTNVFSGRPARGIPNRAMTELGPMSPLAPEFPLAGNAMGVLRKAAELRGLDDFSPLWSGTGAAALRQEDAGSLTRWLAGVD